MCLSSVNELNCLCLSSDNERNFYLDPDFITDIPAFNQYLDDYAVPSLQEPAVYTEPVYTLNSFYVSGDPVYIVYPNEAQGEFILPQASVSSECIDTSSLRMYTSYYCTVPLRT